MFGCTNENETGPHVSLTFIANEEIDKLHTVLNNTFLITVNLKSDINDLC